jgi:hypothetical protein
MVAVIPHSLPLANAAVLPLCYPRLDAHFSNISSFLFLR